MEKTTCVCVCVRVCVRKINMTGRTRRGKKEGVCLCGEDRKKQTEQQTSWSKERVHVRMDGRQKERLRVCRGKTVARGVVGI